MSRIGNAVIVVATLASVCTLWWANIPLGIPGEWVWERVPLEADFVWNTLGVSFFIGLYMAIASLGLQRLNRHSHDGVSTVEISFWLSVLVVTSFSWMWIVQEAAPVANRLGKAAFVLYYPSSSGYFTKARYEEPDPAKLLNRYESLMAEGDVLHVGTHPPGLFLIFHGITALCERSSLLSDFLDATQVQSFQDASDVIAANVARSQSSRAFLPRDRRVLWLATLLVMASSSLVVIPLFGVVYRSHGAAVAWITASLWATVPAAVVFVPKSDVVYALIGMLFVWAWFECLHRRSIVMAGVVGGIAWFGMMMSLAFLPVFLFGALVVVLGLLLTSTRSTKVCSGHCASGEPTSSCEYPDFSQLSVARLIAMIFSSLVGFGIPTIFVGAAFRINLLSIWWMNYRNHAGFYRQYTRTYWKWLSINPIEFSFSAGFPIAVLAVIAAFQYLKPVFRATEPTDVLKCGEALPKRDSMTVITTAMLAVGLILWLSGKNSGEAARLWILFLPWVVWLAGPCLARADRQQSICGMRPSLIALGLQLVVCFLTVARINGFHFEF